jgi:Tfp pilus assembly protein PilZ
MMVDYQKGEPVMNNTSVELDGLPNRSVRERREGQRDRRILDATMKYQGAFSGVEVRDVSQSGAYVVADAVPCLSDTVTLALDLPSLGGSILVSGRVRRVTIGSRLYKRDGGFGVQFTHFYSYSGEEILRRHLDN